MGAEEYEEKSSYSIKWRICCVIMEGKLMEKKNFNYMLGSENELPKDFDVDQRYDPDDGCKQLYDDQMMAYFRYNKDVENWEQKSRYNLPCYTIRVIEKDFLFSSDYIGPSVYWARERGISDDRIRNFLAICRRLGGHILLPRGGDRPKGVYTPNQAKAGNKGVYDRIDWFLQLLKIFYASQQRVGYYLQQANLLLPEEFRNKKNFNEKFIQIYKSLEFYKDEFLYFKNFEGFCNCFKLVGSLVDKEYNVVEMTKFFPILPEDYEEYIDNLCDAIETRNERLHLLQDVSFVNLMDDLFINGGECYTYAEILGKLEENGLDCTGWIVDELVLNGWLTACGNNIYTR